MPSRKTNEQAWEEWHARLHTLDVVDYALILAAGINIGLAIGNLFV